jgi:hypothetical protein
MRAAAREVEVAAVVRLPKRFHTLSPKDATEDLHRQEEAGVFRRDPALVIMRGASGRDDAMHVRMTDEGLPGGRPDEPPAPVLWPKDHFRLDQASGNGTCRLPPAHTYMDATVLRQGGFTDTRRQLWQGSACLPRGTRASLTLPATA